MKKKLGSFSLAMMNVVTVASLRNLPLAALLGFGLVFYYGIAALLFFIPVSLICMDFVVHFPKGGGVYLWVKEAFGPKAGFLAIWLQWLENVVYYPTLLSFIAGTLLSLIAPDFLNNKLLFFFIVLAVFWIFTLINLRGLEATAFISNWGGTIGTIIPAIIIVALGLSWWFLGKPGHLSLASFEIPDFTDFSQLSLLSGMALSFAGMEVSEVHVEDVQNPKKNYPFAIGISAVIVLAIYIFGSLAIAMVVPSQEISLVAGLIEAFSLFFDAYNLSWFIPIIGLCMIFGAVATLSTWIVGPTRGILVAAQEGHLPKFFQKTNKKGMPAVLLITQAIIVSILASAFLFMPTVNSSFWILTVLSVQYYLIMYLMVFIAAMTLQVRKKIFPKRVWFVSIIGCLTCLFIFIVGFFPPEQIEVGKLWVFETFLIVGILVGILVALLPHRSKAG